MGAGAALGRAGLDQDGSPHYLVGPLLTLTVLLLAFVPVTANGSYGKAEVGSRGEARALDHLEDRRVRAGAPAGQVSPRRRTALRRPGEPARGLSDCAWGASVTGIRFTEAPFTRDRVGRALDRRDRDPREGAGGPGGCFNARGVSRPDGFGTG